MRTVVELAAQFQDQAEQLNMQLYEKRRQQPVYTQGVMLETLHSPVRVAWIYYRTRYVALH